LNFERARTYFEDKKTLLISQAVERFTDKIFLLLSSYIPTRLWGFSGHVQTILQSLIGRVKCPWPLGERVYISLHDGSTLTYDLYQPLNQNHDEEITVAVCPGVGNSSESVYIRTFVHYAQCHGYRIAVLNHIGVIDTIQVTSPRIFTYGEFNFRVGRLNGVVRGNEFHLRGDVARFFRFTTLSFCGLCMKNE
jgi:predicted alpha/beta-fold hydrolase